MEIVVLILCAALGIALIVVEAFMPGFGLPGISGILLEIASVVIAYVHQGATMALITALILLTIIAIVLSIALRSAAKGRFARSKMVLHDVEDAKEGFVAGEDMQVFMGREGVTTTPLRPTGMAEFDGVRLNVSSEGAFLESGVRVLVTRTEGNRIVVRPLTEKA